MLAKHKCILIHASGNCPSTFYKQALGYKLLR